MSKLKSFLKKERILWHNHFWPSICAALVVAVIFYFLEESVGNLILFSSVGASAVILMNRHSHHLTKLFTALSSYLIAIIVGSFFYFLNSKFTFSVPIELFLVIFISSILMFLLNSFHPPAVAAVVGFILIEASIISLAWLFLLIAILLVSIRFVAYVLFESLSLREFGREFRFGFAEEIRKSF